MKKLAGVPASPGIATGKAFLYTDYDFTETPHYAIKKEQCEAEIQRLADAYSAAESEVKIIHEKALRETSREPADIFAAYLLMLQDTEIIEQAKTGIRNSLENAEWVIRQIFLSLAQAMSSSEDPALRERVSDLNDVSKRILGHLLNVQKKTLSGLDSDAIVTARDLPPSEILAIDRTHIKGLVIAQGSRTSHIAIMARALGIPAVTGLAAAAEEIGNDNVLIIDGGSGIVLVNPDENEIKKYHRLSIQQLKNISELDKLKNLPAETKDGYTVTLKANIEIPEEAETALRCGALGIGLYRSEFLFLNSGRAADEENQLDSYSRVLKTMGNLPVTIRTIDIGGDKILPDFQFWNDKNPLLGWRAIRLSLGQPEMFKTQLRALLRASLNGSIRIMFPMISGIEELEQALSLLEEAKAECRSRGQEFSDKIETGIMIEVPSAAITADILAEKSDFFSIGTNDLIQYTLAVDRGNERVDYLAQPLHPAVIRSIKMTIDAAHRKGIKAAICGETAGDPEMTALLLGLGLDEFSMTAFSIPQIKKIIRGLTVIECRALAENVLAGKSAAGNRAAIGIWMNERFKTSPETAE